MTNNNGTAGTLDFGILTELLGYNIRLTQVAIFRDFVSSLSDYDITPTQFGTLVIIKLNPGIKQSDLAQAVQLDRSTVVPLIDHLEKDGLVIRQKLASDRRTNALKLTSHGSNLVEKLIQQVLEHEKRLASNLTKDEQIQLVNLLKKILPK